MQTATLPITMTTRKRDGAVVITVYGEDIANDPANPCLDWQVGDEGVLLESERVMQPTGIVGVELIRDPDGVGGNMDPSAKRLHGWRGTTNDVARHAHGWRRVQSIEPRKRGHGWRIVLSPDMRPDDD